jgi:ribosomal-protein-alanine N-acetyltransferase
MSAEIKREPIAATIRAFDDADVESATEILKRSPEAAQWTEWGFRELPGWRGVVALVSERGTEGTGFVIGRQAADEAEILNLAVAPTSRCQGEGGALLKAALEEFRSRGVSRVFLEVRESNKTGIAFYEKHGFSKTGRRAGYYLNPKEAAIAMEKKLKGQD